MKPTHFDHYAVILGSNVLRVYCKNARKAEQDARSVNARIPQGERARVEWVGEGNCRRCGEFTYYPKGHVAFRPEVWKVIQLADSITDGLVNMSADEVAKMYDEVVFREKQNREGSGT